MATIEEQLNKLREETLASLKKISTENEKEMQNLRVSVLGKKGSLTEILKGMKDVSADMRPIIGKHVNEARDVLTAAFEESAKLLEEQKVANQLASESVDVTLPGRKISAGNRHVLSQTSEEIEDIFIGMGYQVVDGFEVETDYYNFERMNLPKDHPARDMQDTFYITEEILLRTHTSPVQARAMDAHDFSKGPLKMISPGRVFRRDTDDATHSHQFHQIEGLVVGFLWQTFKGHCSSLCKKCLEKTAVFVCVRLISHLQSRLLRWMFLALNAVGKAAMSAKRLAGLKLWELEWYTHASLK